MKKYFAIILSVMISIVICSTTQAAEAKAKETQVKEESPVKMDKGKVSYCVGVDVGSNFKDQEIDLDLDKFLKGVKDVLSGKDLEMKEEEMIEIRKSISEQLMRKRQERIRKMSEENMNEGMTFLNENKKRKEVKTLPSGLQYEVIKEGTGPIPTIDDTVTTNYRGTLIDGTEFDSSYKRGKPATFGIKGVIKGWKEALQKMKTGAKWKLFIPSHLAYGQRGSYKIGPNKTLLFEVELLSIVKKEEQKK